MTTKRFLLAWLSSAVILFILNGIFHGVVAADFFDRNNEGLGAAAVNMADFNPAPVAVLELILVFCLAWVLLKIHSRSITLRDAMTVGGLFQLSSSATWNLANMATLVSWPLQVLLVDVAWHTLMGILAGWLIYRFGWPRSVKTRQPTGL